MHDEGLRALKKSLLQQTHLNRWGSSHQSFEFFLIVIVDQNAEIFKPGGKILCD